MNRRGQSQRVAVVIPAKDESARIAATVRAARAIPYVDLVLVVDDGSTDDTQHVARAAGAVVVRHSVNRGKASAMETGASVVAMRDAPQGPPRLLVFIDADLGGTAVGVAPLVDAVLAGTIEGAGRAQVDQAADRAFRKRGLRALDHVRAADHVGRQHVVHATNGFRFHELFRNQHLNTI